MFCNHRTRELESIVKDKNIGKRTYLSEREPKRSSQLSLHGEMPRNPDSLPIKKKRNGLGHIVASDNSTILIQSRGQRSSTKVLNHRVASHHRPSHRTIWYPGKGKAPVLPDFVFLSLRGGCSGMASLGTPTWVQRGELVASVNFRSGFGHRIQRLSNDPQVTQVIIGQRSPMMTCQ